MKSYKHISSKLYKSIQDSVPILNIDAIIYNEHGQVYLQRRPVVPHKGKWTIIGGRLGWHENVLDCLKRHVSESGLKIVNASFVGYHDWKRNDSRQHSVSLIFLTKVTGIPSSGKFFETLPNNVPLSVRTCIDRFLYYK